MSEEIRIRRCESLEDFRLCLQLQREIWGEDDLEVEPVTMFVVAAHIGGQVLGAFDGSRMVGYTLALPGIRNGQIFLHSHMTGVSDGYRDRGAGRALKLFQREEALGRGIRLIEWTFDPLELRNAHFNLNRLGAICRTYLPNLYGVTTSPLHRNLPTDRLVAEWHLDSPRVIAILAGAVPEPAEAPATISFPAALENWKKNNPEEVARQQARARAEFESWFARGYAAIATRSTPADAGYLLAPWSDF
jgi:predicted GNAT superfamily acetyltransferase